VKLLIRLGIWVLVWFALFTVISCAYLDDRYPDDRGHPVSQLGKAARDIGSSAEVQAIARVIPGGEAALGILTGGGGLALAIDQALRHWKDHRRVRELEARLPKGAGQNGKNYAPAPLTT
jgi:hypothetical protein